MAKELTLFERLEWVKDTLREGGSASLKLSDEQLADTLFMDLDIDTWSALHSNTLDALHEAGLISDPLRQRCGAIRVLARELIDGSVRPVTGHFIRNSKDWQELMRLCDEALVIMGSSDHGE
jgi:hypothetical protein